MQISHHQLVLSGLWTLIEITLTNRSVEILGWLLMRGGDLLQACKAWSAASIRSGLLPPAVCARTLPLPPR
jgi:hypothetical protein